MVSRRGWLKYLLPSGRRSDTIVKGRNEEISPLYVSNKFSPYSPYDYLNID